MTTPPISPDAAALARYAAADVIFVAQDGFTLAPARVRCYSFAKLLRQRGLQAEVLSFFDHLGAADQGGPVLGAPIQDKLRLNLAAYDILARNPRAVLYVQKAGYHGLACMLAAGRNGNPIILDYDDYDLDGHSFQDIESWLPCLAPDRLLASLASGARACVVSSHRIFDLVAPYNADVRLIHTVADQETFTPDGRDQPRRRFGDSVNILWCGDVWGHIPLKDLFFATDAFAMIPDDARRRARFHIIGFGGAWETAKARMAQRYAGVGNIILHDFIPPAEMPAVFREMDIGVLPYHVNAFNLAKSPTKMFEYMLAKVTVLATPVGEVVHCLKDGESVALADGLTAFSEQMARLIGDDALRRRIAEGAYRRALAEYSLQGVGDRLEAVVRKAMACSAGGNRTTEGKTTEGETTEGETLETFVGRRLGRSAPPAPREIELALADLQMLAAAEDLEAADPRRWSAPLLALLDWPGLAAHCGVAPDRLLALRDIGPRLRNSARLRPRLGLAATAVRPVGPPRFNKLAAAEDWEDSAWFAWLKQFKSGGCASFYNGDPGDLSSAVARNHTYNYFKRGRGAWVRTQFLYGLDRLGLLNSNTTALVACMDIDGFYLLLTQYVAQVDVVDLGAAAAARALAAQGGGLDPWLLKPRPFRHDRLTIHHGPVKADEVSPDRRWDAVIVPQGKLIGDAAAVAVIDRIAARVRPGGVLAFSAPFQLNAETPPTPPWRPAGFAPVDDFDASISDATLDRAAPADGRGADSPRFVTETADGLFAPAVWFLRRPG